MKASEKSICAIKRKKKVEDITWPTRGPDRKKRVKTKKWGGDVDGYQGGEKRQKRGVDGIYLGEEG